MLQPCYLVPRNNIIRNNLVMGTIKEMEGKSPSDLDHPSSFSISDPANWVENNVAAGGERFGFAYYGLPCGATPATFAGSFTGNAAHSYLNGLWLQASQASWGTGCTQLANFTTYMNWDYGVVRSVGVGKWRTGAQ